MKKLLARTLAILMVSTFTIPAMALDATTPTGDVEVSYNVSSTYTVTIPEAQEFTAVEGKTGDVELAAGAILPFGETLTVTMSSANFSEGFRMKDGTNENYLGYTISNNSTEVETNGATVLSVAAADAPAGASTTLTFTPDTPTIAGDYSDTLTFTVAVG